MRAQVKDTTLVLPAKDTLFLPHKDLKPGSVKVFSYDNQPVKPTKIDEFNGIILLNIRNITTDSLKVSYAYFLQKIPEKFSFDDSITTFARIMENPENAIGIEHYYKYRKQQQDWFFGDSKLKKTGSLSRAVTIGNTQDVSVYSDFRLSLEGDLGDSLFVEASISDANLPIQPDGTSQNIQDFDKIFIKLSKNPFYAILGDFEVMNKGTQFANFYRNLLGVQVGRQKNNAKAQASISVAKGKFHTNSFQGENGKQGPYQLQGRNNETLIIILAGSEKVYINGQLKKRGIENDYVIDYNTGQITFTNNVIITNITRIVVDFEYIDRNYARTMQFLSVEDKYKNLSFKFSYAGDLDNYKAPLDFEFGEEEYRALREAGDSVAIILGVDTVAYDSTQILYAYKDTILYGKLFSFFYYSRNPDSAKYQLTFSYVGQGKGHYIKEATLINGNVFKWVGEDSLGNKLGDYEPIKPLPLPQKKQVADLVLRYDLSENVFLKSETAVSNYDKNRLSAKNDDDNVDVATRNSLFVQDLKMSPSLKIGLESYFQYVGKRYETIDRVYPKEYGRIWNYDDLNTRNIERVFFFKPSINFKDRYTFLLENGYRIFGENEQTLRNGVNILMTDTTFLQGNFSSVRIETRRDSLLSTWWQTNGDVYFGKKALTLGTKIWTEDKKELLQDTVSNGSFRFYDFTPYLKIQKEKWSLSPDFNWRQDFEFYQNKFRYKSLAWMPGFAYSLHFWKNWDFSHSVKYRKFILQDSVFSQTGLQDEQQWFSQVRSSQSFLKRAISTTLSYNLTTHKVPRKEIVFVRVNPGFGQYEWIDYNNDGIQQLDEFQPSINPLIADYIRVLLPSKKLESVVTANINFLLRIRLKRLLKNKFLQGIETRTKIRIYSQSKRSDLQAFLPLDFSDRDSVVNNSLLLKNSLFLLKNISEHKLVLSQLYSRNRQALTLAFEDRKSTNLKLEYEYKLDSKNRWFFIPEIGNTYRFNPEITNQNMNLDFLHFETGIRTYGKRRRYTLTPSFDYKENKENQTLNALVRMYKIKQEFRLTSENGFRFNLSAEIFYTFLSGTPNQGTAFVMLEGQSEGKNFRSNLSVSRRVLKNIEVSVNYDLRASEKLSPVHSLRGQFRAFF